jgi:hypothetical protein
MDILQISGIAAFTLMSLAFYVARRMVLFNVFCVLIFVAFLLVIRYFGTGPSPEMLVMTSGILLYWFGLVIVRVMLQRSVSLHLLLSYFLKKPAETIQEEVSERFKDALFFRLVKEQQDTFRLTLFGKFIASIVATFYTLVRTER